MEARPVSIETRIARLFGLKQGDDWLRHTNPWSVYTRIPIPVLLVAAVWSRVWLGWWSLVPIAAVLVWTVINPRVFPAPESTDHWASRGVLGETYWAGRNERPVPPRHRTAPLVLAGVSAIGVPFIVWGLVVLDPWMTAFGVAVQSLGKIWFIDRMALLYDDVVAGPEPPPSP